MARLGTSALNALEQRVSEHIAGNEDELVALLQRLIGFDTVAADIGASAGEVAPLQGYLAERLRDRGADVTLTEPDALALAGHPFIADGFSFAGRPQLVARFAGTGGGRTLLLNGHVDVVSVEPRDAWTSIRSAARCATRPSSGAAPAT